MEFGARASTATGGLGVGVFGSMLVHSALLGFVLWHVGQPEPVRPPVYRVELIGQAGKRQIGVERPQEPAAEAPAAAAAERAVKEEKVLPDKAARKSAVKSPKATPSIRPKKSGGETGAKAKGSKTAAPKSGAGATGTKGADVANVRIPGIDFPYPGYLNNIVRQIALNWQPRRVSAALVAEVRFFIRRDGSVGGIEVLKGSGDLLYDVDARGAIEAVGTTRAFGPLPAGWSRDDLVVYFKFDYALRPN